ncbi:MFS transporter [Nocardioides szechwanensis]|uniref:Drug resistance transporter, EmrB/QacA subfamily n=1 Tax=Nocardioides szechwanensis TaxID=1005944 RepID=A0A1H0J4D8_9ACTN|nr:MFS transporter [Nocardioides szechwanensis]GEP35006.1 MFS transporter [Nocardioides szechwanensis]SDO38604.1 drug resistance transporter, EmrB/QacA subfamily [Nocardioides szechwanensis]
MTTHTPQVPDPVSAEARLPKRSWSVLAVALAAQILVVLDISVVNTALPSIGRSLELDGGQLQWLVTAYLMMSGGGLLLGGRIADLLSRRAVFLTGLALFTIASLVSGFADSGGQLIAARAVQGLSAALLTPSALSLVTTSYDGEQRKLGLAIWGAVGSLGVALGVLLGGAVTTWTSWEFIFWLNVPVGGIALAAGLLVLPPDADRVGASLTRLDLPGAATVIGGLVALVYGLGASATHGWSSVQTMGSLVTSGVLVVAFLAVERRASDPLFPPHVWKLRTLVSSTTVMLGVTGILVGTVFLTSIFIQTVLGFSALDAGLAFLPFALAITVGTIVARHLMAHLSPRSVATAGLLLAAGAAALMSTASATSSYAGGILPGLVGLGLGVGMVFVPVSVTAMSGIPASHAGVASGFLMTGHEVGAALGVAVLSAVASTAGSLTSPAGAVAGFERGFLAAAVIAVAVALVARWRMPSTRAEAGAGMHMHH